MVILRFTIAPDIPIQWKLLRFNFRIPLDQPSGAILKETSIPFVLKYILPSMAQVIIRFSQASQLLLVIPLLNMGLIVQEALVQEELGSSSSIILTRSTMYI